MQALRRQGCQVTPWGNGWWWVAGPDDLPAVLLSGEEIIQLAAWLARDLRADRSGALASLVPSV